ncbi:MAG: ADP-ribosylation factor-like protein [Promethearchaeota archaeon]|jgi:small GTP-binding protein
MKDAFAKGGKQVEYHDYYKYRISYIAEKDKELIFLFVTGLTDNFENIKKELIKCKKEFLNLFEDVIQHKIDAKTFEVFDPTIDIIHRNLRPKISLIGFSGVGKTTITRLIKAEEIPMQHIPTITGDIATIRIGKLHFHLWDFAGQEQFSYLWNNFIKGSDAVLLITDSTLENLEKSKFFLELIKEQAPQAHTSVIGNKQDLEDAVKPEQIEKILGLKTYSMIAKDPGNRDKMITIIADILEMSAEVSPLLQPLLERDIFTEKAMEALEAARFEEAAEYFEKISILCVELGDDSLGKEFFEKSQKIKSMIKNVNISEGISAKNQRTIDPSTKAKESQEKIKATQKQVIEPQKPTEKPPVIEEESKILFNKDDIPEIESLLKPKIPQTDQLQSNPPKKLTPVEKKQQRIVSKKPKEQKTSSNYSNIPKAVPPQQPRSIKHPEIKKVDKPYEPEIIIKPEINQEKMGLNLNPADFMVKQRPKTITAVPKDAKNKLKTSPYGHVINPLESKKLTPGSPTEMKNTNESSGLIPPRKIGNPIVPSKPTIPTVVTPKKIDLSSQTTIATNTKIHTKHREQMINPSQVKSQTEINPTIIPSKKENIPIQATSGKIKKEQKAALEQSLMDLRIKKASITKMSLDFDMKELNGIITSEELNSKKQKLKVVEENIDKQIKEIEKLLSG